MQSPRYMLLIIREKVNPALQRHTENALISISFKGNCTSVPGCWRGNHCKYSLRASIMLLSWKWKREIPMLNGIFSIKKLVGTLNWFFIWVPFEENCGHRLCAHINDHFSLFPKMKGLDYQKSCLKVAGGMNFSHLGLLKSVFKDLPSLGPTTRDTSSLPSGNRLSQMLNSGGLQSSTKGCPLQCLARWRYHLLVPLLLENEHAQTCPFKMRKYINYMRG